MRKKVVIIGAGGHAKVIADIILKSGDKVIGFLDDNQKIGTQVLDYKVIGNINDIANINKNYYYVIGIGDSKSRYEIYNKYRNIKYYTAVHPSAVIAKDVIIGTGTVIMANAVINNCTCIGDFCIINTACVIEHNSIIGNFVHISPTSTLSGTVKVCDFVHIGTGTKVKNNININKKCIIGVGSVIIKDIDEEGIYVGVPAKKIKELSE